MPLDFIYPSKDGKPEMWKNETGNRIYTNADKTKAVIGDDNPDAAYVLVGIGSVIPIAEARKYGLVNENDETIPEAQPVTSGDESNASDSTEEEKSVESDTTTNKAVRPARDK